MRSAFCLTLLACQLSPVAAPAGPWLREEGTTFISSSFSATYFYDLSQSTYIEYGLRETLTLGFDQNTAQSRFGQQSGHATWCDCGGRSPVANEVRYVGLMDISREENDLWNIMLVWMCH